MNPADFARDLAETGELDSKLIEGPPSDGSGLGSWSKRLIGATRMKPAAFADRLAAWHGLSRVHLDRLRAGVSLASEFSLPFLHDHGLYPYRAADGTLRLATADPFNADALDALTVTLGGAVTVEIATFEDIELALDANKQSAAPDGGALEAAFATTPHPTIPMRFATLPAERR